ncbi:MAG TPA: MarR family transcriptional regulator [Candidatus Limnocylindria bacterium]|nr:MarR family transcriptional regulator [Candidatus Limnocylindria bacterium]
MSSTKTPTQEELELAASVFGMFQLFKNVALDASRASAIGSPERGRMLWALKAGPARAGWIAESAKISPSAVTEIVESLERDGFVHREPDPDDRRAVRVALTADGRRQLQRFEQGCAAALAVRLRPLTAAQRHRVRAAMNDLQDAILTDPFTRASHADASVRADTRHREAAHAR